MPTKEKLRDFAPKWLKAQTHLRPRTVERYEINVRCHVLPLLGHLRLIGDVAGGTEPADLMRHGQRARAVEVGDDHAARALLGEAPRHRAPDARSTAGHHDHPVGEVHRCIIGALA